jgi:hypothetical protein
MADELSAEEREFLCMAFEQARDNHEHQAAGQTRTPGRHRPRWGAKGLCNGQFLAHRVRHERGEAPLLEYRLGLWLCGSRVSALRRTGGALPIQFPRSPYWRRYSDYS